MPPAFIPGAMHNGLITDFADEHAAAVRAFLDHILDSASRCEPLAATPAPAAGRAASSDAIEGRSTSVEVLRGPAQAHLHHVSAATAADEPTAEEPATESAAPALANALAVTLAAPVEVAVTVKADAPGWGGIGGIRSFLGKLLVLSGATEAEKEASDVLVRP